LLPGMRVRPYGMPLKTENFMRSSPLLRVLPYRTRMAVGNAAATNYSDLAGARICA
jgi:hypothetical protein